MACVPNTLSPLPDKSSHFTATRNACKLCTPLGACFVFRGIEKAIPFLHGSQGCSTYIRRYMISHFKEPVDIASSNFSEDAAIFGGARNLTDGLANVIRQYDPKLIGVATTCLSETIGDDVRMFLHEFRAANKEHVLPAIVHVSTPSYTGTHMDGFHSAVRAVVETVAQGGERQDHLNILPGMLSPADIRYLREILDDFRLDATILPDYSETLDGPAWAEYQLIPEGGTTVEEIEQAGRARATIEFGSTWNEDKTAGAHLAKQFDVPRFAQGLPIGVRQTDAFIARLEALSGAALPKRHEAERGRLIDSFVDAHKHVSGKRAVVYGEEDLIVGLVSFLTEIGVKPVMCVSGAKSGKLAAAVAAVAGEMASEIMVCDGTDFVDMTERVAELEPDLLIGSSKGFKTAKQLDIPLIRVGFPVHDRIGGARVLHIGYRGAQQLFDRIANAIIERKQAASEVGYTYM
jgi:nitrogenase molybdenum-iron protein NifN